MKNKWHSSWQEVLNNYFENECKYCTSTDNLHLHHIIPLSHGGKNVISNLELVCWPCHKKLHKQLGYCRPQNRWRMNPNDNVQSFMLSQYCEENLARIEKSCFFDK